MTDQQPDPADPQTMMSTWDGYQARRKTRDLFVHIMAIPFAVTALGYLLAGWPGWLLYATLGLFIGCMVITYRIDRRDFLRYLDARDRLFNSYRRRPKDIP